MAFDDKKDDRNERKERVIHTRISESLDEEIRKTATGLGLSVSNLVRNILLNTFGLVEDIMADSAHLARSAPGADWEEPRPSATTRSRQREGGGETAGPVLGWQQIVLNLNAVCDRCNAILAKGSEASVAVRDGAGPRTIICPRCLEEATHGNAAREPTG